MCIYEVQTLSEPIAMHPVEAVSILSQLASVPSSTMLSFAETYADIYDSVPVHTPVKAYMPLFTEFSYQSGLRLDASTGSTRFDTRYGSDPYIPNPDGAESEYSRSLFYMTRDVRVLEKIVRVNLTPKGFYCVRNAKPIKSDLGVAEFKEVHNVDKVYPCTGQLHDEHVPKCVCPVPPPPKELADLKRAITSLRLAAPFPIRVAELHLAAATAHKVAAEEERAAIAPSALLVFSLEEEEVARVVHELDADIIEEGSNDDEPYSGLKDGDYANTRSARQLAVDRARAYDKSRTSTQKAALTRAKEARTAGDLADQELAEYIERKENEAFALFKPKLRKTLTVARRNNVDGYPVPSLVDVLIENLPF